MSDLISRQAVIELVKNSYYNLAENMDDVWAMVKDVEQIPSADRQDDNRLYIKIYADDEPSRKAEKLYQICGETENQDVAQWLKEYFPSADRPSGKWQRVNEQPYFRKHYHKVCCSVCHKQGSEKYNYCPNCGTRMTPYKGGEDE